MDDTATVEIIFAPAVVPLITRLEEQFTQYDIEQISGLSSAYAVVCTNCWFVGVAQAKHQLLS